MSGAERQEALQWDEAMRWLAKAEGGLAGARLLLAGEAHDLAAFHAQQAVEKLLKALLVAAAKDVRRTHDIETLAVLARAHWPEIVPSPFPPCLREPMVCDDALSRDRRCFAKCRGSR